MQLFHSDDYVDFLKKITPDNMKVEFKTLLQQFSCLLQQKYSSMMQRFNVGEYTDCPVFDGLYEFCQIYSGNHCATR